MGRAGRALRAIHNKMGPKWKRCKWAGRTRISANIGKLTPAPTPTAVNRIFQSDGLCQAFSLYFAFFMCRTPYQKNGHKTIFSHQLVTLSPVTVHLVADAGEMQ